MNKSSWITLSAVFLSTLLSLAATAQENALPRIALTEAPKNDADYSLMGEFVGPISVGENKYSPLGLQIRPIGNGLFEALQYTGGLPGQKTFAKKDPLKLVGTRSGDLLILSGGPWAIFVEKDGCLIVDRKGNKVGRLERIKRGSPTMGAKAPAGATVLFDGSGTDQFTTARMTEDGLLMEGADTLPMFQDFNLHVEFRLPYMPNSEGQKRGNSGCYLQSRYEVQVLDSFATTPVFNGCSALYRFKSPDLNMCLPPLQWQTYDIKFTAPRWGADGTKLRNARITVWQNGVKTQDDVELPNKTGAGKVEEPTLLPIRFQNHSDPVRFRNIWIVDRGLVSTGFPVSPKVLTEAEKKALAKKARIAKAQAAKKAEQERKKAEAKKQSELKKQAELNQQAAEKAKEEARKAADAKAATAVKAKKQSAAPRTPTPPTPPAKKKPAPTTKKAAPAKKAPTKKELGAVARPDLGNPPSPKTTKAA